MMSISSTQKVMTRHYDSEYTDLSMMADEVAFTLMPSGDTTRGVEAVRQMLNDIYHVAFDARAEARNLIFADEHAVWEGHFIGRHTGEFVGLAATGKEVCVPMCVVYDLENDQVKKGRIYLEMPVMLEQLGGETGSE
jgi:predicted ester cyclase